MSDSKLKIVGRPLVPWFVLFFTIKWWGTSLAAWSWWWCLAPAIPICWLIVQRFHL